MVNLLLNGDFEGGYRPLWDEATHTKPHHTAYVYEVDRTGGPITKRYTVERGEIHNPVGWWAWYAHQRNDETPVPWDPDNRIGWSEPEIRLTETVHQRHRSGLTAAYLFTWRRIHEGGLLQQVAVTPGARLRFTAYTHAWIGDDDHPPTWSLPGDGALAWPAGTPGLNSDQRSVTQSIGIDPTGGTDPYAPTVVWSPGWHIFNAYRAEPLEVEAVAAGATVTVFLRSSTLWPVIHNDVAWDDCELVELEPGVEPPADRGTPRVQYERVYMLLHESETTEMWLAAIRAMRSAHVSYTLGPSADDAGIGDLDSRTVIAVNPALWDNDLEAFFAQHYPGVTYRPVYAATPDDLDTELRVLISGATPTPLQEFSQRDPRWASERMLPSTRTIGGSGCAMVAACMIAAQVDSSLTPLELNRRLSANGGYTAGGLLYWSKVQAAVPGLRFRAYTTWRTTPKPDADMARVYAALERGPCIIQVDHNPGGSLDTHFVVAFGRLGDDIAIVDPWDGDTTTVKARYWRGSLPQSIFALAEYEIVDTAPVVPPDVAGSLMGLHLQDMGPGQAVLDFVSTAKPASMKIFDPGMAPQIRARSPQTRIVYRHCLTRADELACLDDPVNRARWFLDQFAEQVRPYVERGEITHIETAVNETMDGPRVEAAIAFELAFITELRHRLPGARPVVATIAVGNPHESQYPLLVPLAQATAQAGGAFGYHSYWPVQQRQSFLVSDWQWHAGRFEALDELFRQHGFVVDWLLSEAGPCGGERHPNYFAYDPAAGWRHAQCFDGDWALTLNDVRTFVQKLQQSRARVVGATWFTICGWDWEWFTLNEQQIADLAMV